MDILDCTVTHIWLLTGRRLSSCSVETSHTELYRCLISPNETGSPPMTTSRQSPTRRSRKSRIQSWTACPLNCRLQRSSLLYSMTKVTCKMRIDSFDKRAAMSQKLGCPLTSSLPPFLPLHRLLSLSRGLSP